VVRNLREPAAVPVYHASSKYLRPNVQSKSSFAERIISSLRIESLTSKPEGAFPGTGDA
jgi:hypothetical protein